jgi:hypothetical protein
MVMEPMARDKILQPTVELRPIMRLIQALRPPTMTLARTMLLSHLVISIRKMMEKAQKKI